VSEINEIDDDDSGGGGGGGDDDDDDDDERTATTPAQYKYVDHYYSNLSDRLNMNML
jgi:hypothetical protein